MGGTRGSGIVSSAPDMLGMSVVPGKRGVGEVFGSGWLLLFAMIRSVVKSFKVPGVEVVASRMSNEAALTRMIDSTPKKPWSYLTLVLDG